VGSWAKEEIRIMSRKWAFHALALVSVWASLEGNAPGQVVPASSTAQAGAMAVPLTKPVAAVNGEAITMLEVEAVVKLLPPAPVKPTDGQMQQLRREALEMLIDDVLMRQFLSKNGRHVEPREVEQRVAELQTALKSQNRSLNDFLSDTGQTENHLRLDVLKKLQWDDLVRAQMTDENLERYFAANRDFYAGVTVRASHILVRVPATAGPQEIENARTMLTDLRQKVIVGQLDFAEAARKYSQCTSAAQGGDIGYFPRKWAVDERIARTAFGMKVGEVSEVVQSDYGLHLVKVTDRKAGQPCEYNKMKEEVRENFAMELWQTMLAQQRKSARIEIRLP
jgi:parvulin-like peptidyl-prolyl isomerase